MAVPTVARRSDAVQIAALLGSPEIAQLVTELAATRWTGRPGYPLPAMVGMALAKSLHTLPTWTRTVGLVREHAALRAAIGCPDPSDVPSVHACDRFTAKLRKHKPLLDACVDRVTAALHEQLPELGATVAIDASDLPAYANGQRYLHKGGPSASGSATRTPPGGTARPSPPARPGASTATSCTSSCAWRPGCRWRGGQRPPRTASPASPSRCWRRSPDAGSGPRSPSWTWAMTTPGLRRLGGPRLPPGHPAAPDPAVKAGNHKPPVCAHGEWTFAGTDAKRQARPSGAARPASVPRPARGSPPSGCTPSSRAARPGGSSATASADRWSGRTAGSSTSGACCPCGSGASSGSGCTPTLRSSPG